MSVLSSLRVWWHGFNTRRKMNRVFSRGEDPYRYAESPYERARLDAMEASLKPCARALEVGCAEGLFTARLAKLAREVVALDISPVALERARRRVGAGVRLEEADLRRWSPEPGWTFSAIVLGDVLYYLDKPLVQAEFVETFPRVASWLERGGTLVLAHGFAGPKEREHREGFRKRFEAEGLTLREERVLGEGESEGKVCCLLSILTK
ncbi:MAG: class I SAM-dependent methyltransferase [Elusimicrobia bacterium]|nr:class I SAM-dependent methyltransferase [Elusimicrobiota bacterium]